MGRPLAPPPLALPRRRSASADQGLSPLALVVVHGGPVQLLQPGQAAGDVDAEVVGWLVGLVERVPDEEELFQLGEVLLRREP